MSQSIAFKCTYNDGGEGALVGFAGTCSVDNIALNVHNQRAWCSSPSCECQKFYAEGRKGRAPDTPCMESSLFRKWEYGAGGFHTGIKSGKKIHLIGTGIGNFAILTTRFPRDTEENRRIVGLFQIGEIRDTNTVVAQARGRIRLPLEEARQLYFWAYHTTSNGKPAWGSLLFRYLKNDQVHRILADVAETVRDETTRDEIHYLISQVFGDASAPPASGCLAERSLNRSSAMATFRKYGPSGEGNAHKELKHWIAAHPEALGLNDTNDVKEERSFVSGDRADLVFSHASGRYTVVEIETTMPRPGAYQAIKYRALLCAEKGWSLSSDRVDSILVAWSIPDDVRAFCETYGLLWREQMLP